MERLGNPVDKTRLGILHPGAMGISVAAAAQNSGYEVCWASDKRSGHTAARALEYQLLDLGTLEVLCRECEILVSVCPPSAADAVADQVVNQGYTGYFLDANAISPHRVLDMAGRLEAAGIVFVDGGIIGGPAWEQGATTLYLSGEQAAVIAACFTAGPLSTTILGEQIGTASALKMCYAAWTKGRTALLCGILAAAEKLDVWEALAEQWEGDWPGFGDESVHRVQRVTAKAWRFAGEMEEIAATFAGVGLPDGFHLAAAELYQRIGQFKDAPSLPKLETVLEALLFSAGPPEDDVDRLQ